LAPGICQFLYTTTATSAPGLNSTLAVSLFESSSLPAGLLSMLLYSACRVTVPANLEARGVSEVVLADEEGAPRAESVVAGPLVLLEDPVGLGLALLG
jgi:hypothetical protein